jgi:SAM-dependent methyltransferase
MSEIRFDASGDSPARLKRVSPWWGVHAARYEFAAPYVPGCHVLDIACGTGYGMPILGGRARRVVGVDMDLRAVRTARAQVGDRPGTVVAADGGRLPFHDGAFDVVTSFETLEHLTERGAFLAELRRVLGRTGLGIISTPNANYTRPVNGKPRNPHHVFEYTPAELRAELQKHFGSVELLGQMLHPRFTISPFVDDHRRMPRTVGPQTRLFLWRVMNKLPAALRDTLSQGLWGHAWFPDVGDYCFGPGTVEEAPDLVALCRPTAEVA